MHALYLFSPVDIYIGRSTIFYPALAGAALLEVGWLGISSPRKFYPPSREVGFFPFVFFNKMLSPTHWIFFFAGFSAMYISGNPSMDPLRYWGFHSIIPYLTFLEWAPKWSEELEGSSCATSYWWYVQVFSTVSLLLADWIVHLAAIGWRRSCGIILVLWFSCEKGSGVFWGTSLWWKSTPLESFSLPSGLLVHWQKVFVGQSSLLSNKIYFCCRITSCSVEEDMSI